MSIFHHCRETPRKVKIYSLYTKHAHTLNTYVAYTSRFLSARHVYFIIPIVLATLTQFLLFQLLYETKSPYNSSVSLSFSLYHSCIDLFTFSLLMAINVRIQRVHLREKLLNHSRECNFFFFFLRITSTRNNFRLLSRIFFINGYFLRMLNVESSNGHYLYQCPLRLYK